MKKLALLLMITLFSFVAFAQNTIQGFVTYKNPYNTALRNVELTLKDTAGVLIDVTTSNDNGFYQFTNIPNGAYQIYATSTSEWGGNNATDALIVELYTVNLLTLEPLNKQAANVNADWGVNATDALWIKLRVLGMFNYYPNGDWTFDNPHFTVDSITDINIQGLCMGDVNGSFMTEQDIPTGIEDKPAITLTAYPNPFTTSVTVKGVIPIGATVKMEIVSLSGQLMATVYNGTMSAGEFTKSINFAQLNLPSGTYVLLMDVNGSLTAKKLLFTK